MRNKFIFLMGALSTLLLTACSSPKPGTPEFVQKQEVEKQTAAVKNVEKSICLLYTSPSPRDRQKSRMPSSA